MYWRFLEKEPVKIQYKIHTIIFAEIMIEFIIVSTFNVSKPVKQMSFKL